MTLPRSVKEMSKLDFLPKHCESENFRGFSFIGDSFPIPQRNKSEVEHYWNNVEEDGQSLSECASSVFDEDMNEVPPPEPEPAKKKRPPRKKKKKKQQTVPLETTNEGNEKGDAASQTKEQQSSNGKSDVAVTLSITNDAADTLDAQKPETPNEKSNGAISLPNKNDEADTLDAQESANDIVTKEVIKPPEINNSTVANKPHPPQSRLDIALSPKLATTANKSLNPTAKSWEIPKKYAPSSCSKVTPPAQAYPAPPVYAPKPGSWAALAVNAKSDQTRGTVTVSQQVQRPAPAPLAKKKMLQKEHQASPKKPSSDWRTHVVSPRQKKLATNMDTKLAQPPPLASGQSAWPSLGDFPPPPRAKTVPKQQTKPVGAWGRAV